MNAEGAGPSNPSGAHNGTSIPMDREFDNGKLRTSLPNNVTSPIADEITVVVTEEPNMDVPGMPSSVITLNTQRLLSIYSRG